MRDALVLAALIWQLFRSLGKATKAFKEGIHALSEVRTRIREMWKWLKMWWQRTAQEATRTSTKTPLSLRQRQDGKTPRSDTMLQWQCPQCATLNPGRATVCTNGACGVNIPDDLVYHAETLATTPQAEVYYEGRQDTLPLVIVCSLLGILLWFVLSLVEVFIANVGLLVYIPLVVFIIRRSEGTPMVRFTVPGNLDVTNLYLVSESTRTGNPRRAPLGTLPSNAGGITP